MLGGRGKIRSTRTVQEGCSMSLRSNSEEDRDQEASVISQTVRIISHRTYRNDGDTPRIVLCRGQEHNTGDEQWSAHQQPRASRDTCVAS